MRAAFQRILAKRFYALLVVHLLMFAFTYSAAFALRFDFEIPQDHWQLLKNTLPWVLVLKLGLFYQLGSFHGWWRYVTFADLAALLRAATLSTLCIASIDLFVLADAQIPRSVLLMDWGVTILLAGGLRSVWRLGREHVWPTFATSSRRPVLMIGSDQACEGLARQIHHSARLCYRVIGFLNDNYSHHGSRLGGIAFLGSPDSAVLLATKYEVRDLLVIANSISGKRLRKLVDECQEAGIRLKMIPAVDELINGSVRVEIRDVSINDLLRREPVRLDTKALGEMIKGRNVMVTGAGGSIGSEICRQILNHRPGRLIIVERAENNLFQIEQELKRSMDGAELVACVADVRDEERIQAVFRENRPHIVFHAAAHKHVPLMERNPGEAIKNNVFGTKQLADTADEFGVERFVLISTDKAVNPSSVMGVSKHLAERYVLSLSDISTTKFVVVRFGNVLGSSGSVVPIFQEQIRKGGPVTVTHPDMVRFFMSIPEASQLVLQAAAMGDGGEIFVLDMGEPVKILDLAQDLIRLSGLSTDDIEILITGPRPGEKLYEELYMDDEETLPTPHPKLRVCYHRPFTLSEVTKSIAELAPLLHGNQAALRERLQKLTPEYAPPDWSRAAETERTTDTLEVADQPEALEGEVIDAGS